MRYKDELRIAGFTALFCCAMLMITAVVPSQSTKDFQRSSGDCC